MGGPGNAESLQYVSGTGKFWDGSLMIWGSMSPQEVGHIYAR